MTQSYPSTAAGALSGPISNVPLLPILAKRAPTAHDINYAIGQEWVWVAGNEVFFLTSVVNNQATWITIAANNQAAMYQLVTNDGAVHVLATFPVAPNSIVNVNGQIVGKRVGAGNSLGGFINGTAYRVGGGPVIIDAPVVAVQTTDPNAQSADFLINGNNLEVVVEGTNPNMWNWTASLSTLVQLG